MYIYKFVRYKKSLSYTKFGRLTIRRIKSVKLKLINCSAHLTACSGRQRLMFFCKELLITEIDMLLLQYVVGENLIDDCIFVSNRNMPSFLKVGSLKLHFGTLKCKLLLLDDDDSLEK